MIDVMDLACPIMRAALVEGMMTTAGYFGRGGIASAVILLLMGYGYIYNNARCKKAGVALIVAIIASALLTELIRSIVQLPRPRLSSSYGFPSGHTTAAFSLAGVLATAFPGFSSVFYLIASMTGISRLYFRAHYLWDVFGGAAIGLVISILVSKKLIPQPVKSKTTLPKLFGWVATLTIGFWAAVFFYTLETRISAHIVDSDEPPQTSNIVTAVDLGNSEFRPLLGYGWSGDEVWEEGKRSVVWATGIASEIKINLPVVKKYFFRINVFPYSPTGTACQRIEVKVNNHAVAKLSLERGWHWYEFEIPQNTVRVGLNEVQFFYNYTEEPKTRGRIADPRQLSVAFDRIDVIAATSSDSR